MGIKPKKETCQEGKKKRNNQGHDLLLNVQALSLSFVSLTWTSRQQIKQWHIQHESTIGRSPTCQMMNNAIHMTVIKNFKNQVIVCPVSVMVLPDAWHMATTAAL